MSGKDSWLLVLSCEITKCTSVISQGSNKHCGEYSDTRHLPSPQFNSDARSFLVYLNKKTENSTFWKAAALTATERASVKIENVLKYFLHYSGWKTSPWKYRILLLSLLPENEKKGWKRLEVIYFHLTPVLNVLIREKNKHQPCWEVNQKAGWKGRL